MIIRKSLLASLLLTSLSTTAHAYHINCPMGKICTFPGRLDFTSTRSVENIFVDVEREWGSDYTCTLTVNDPKGMIFGLSGSSGFDLSGNSSVYTVKPTGYSKPSLTFHLTGQFILNGPAHFVLIPQPQHKGGTLICNPGY